MGSILRVDMASAEVRMRPFPAEWSKLAGRGLTSKIVSTEIRPTCHPLSKYNKLIIAPGIFAGTALPTSGRTSVGGKSPLTGSVKESNSGGTAGHKLARLGIRAIVVEGRPADGAWSILKVDKGGASLLPGDEIAGLGNYKATEVLFGRYGDKVSLITIGPAGEMRMSGASVAFSDMDGKPTRHAGRGGLGALMGSKGLKAIVVDDAGAPRVEPQRKEEFQKLLRQMSRTLLDDQGTVKLLSAYGTPGVVNPYNTIGAMATRNFSAGSFEGASKICGEKLADLRAQRGGKMHPCMPGCVIACSPVHHGPDGQYLTGAFEYETLVLMGSNLGIDDVDAIARMNRMCDDFGLDTIETGNALGVAIEGGLLKFGDAQRAIEVLAEVGKGTPLGRIIGQGAYVTGRVFGVERVAVAKGQGLPAHEPRANKAVGVTYSTNPMGGDHTAGLVYNDPLNPHGAVEKSRAVQIIAALLDNVGLCRFVHYCAGLNTAENVKGLLNAHLGLDISAEDVLDIGKAVLQDEVAFDRAAGFNEINSALPDFMREEPLPPNNSVFDVPAEEMKKIYNF